MDSTCWVLRDAALTVTVLTSRTVINDNATIGKDASLLAHSMAVDYGLILLAPSFFAPMAMRGARN